MRKKILLTILVLVGLIFLGNSGVNAATYKSDAFEITIPEKIYQIESFVDELQAESSDGSKFVGVSVTSDTGAYLCNKTFMDLYIDNMESRDSSFKLISSKLIESNACVGFEVQYRQTSGYNYTYMSMYCFKSDNYRYLIGFISYDRNYLTSTEKANIINSFKIKDTVTSSFGLPFTDVASNAWYKDAVKYNFENNMIKGLNDYTFGPSNNLTRGMLVTILHRMEGSPAVSGASKFSDVQNTKDYYYSAVKWATQNNIISGYNSGKFGPNDPITREQLAVILSKYSQFKGKYKASSVSLSSFKDSSKVSNFAKTGMQWAVGNGVITGNASSNTLNPLGTTTRAEAASMLYKYCSKVK